MVQSSGGGGGGSACAYLSVQEDEDKLTVTKEYGDDACVNAVATVVSCHQRRAVRRTVHPCGSMSGRERDFLPAADITQPTVNLCLSGIRKRNEQRCVEGPRRNQCRTFVRTAHSGIIRYKVPGYNNATCRRAPRRYMHIYRYHDDVID